MTRSVAKTGTRRGWRTTAALTLGGLLAGLALAGCGGDGGDGGLGALATEVEGIYTVDSYTRNEEACAAEGASVLEELEERFLVVTVREALGQQYVSAVSCADVADCRAKAAADEYAAQYMANFTRAEGEGLAGTQVSTGWSGSEGDLCTAPERLELSLVKVGDEGLRLETRTTVGDDYPADSDGFCTTDGGAAATKGKPCAQLEVLTATFSELL